MSRFSLPVIVGLVVFSACAQPSGSHHSREAAEASPRVIISPIYPDSIFFSVCSVSTTDTRVTGTVPGFHNRKEADYETYFQRYVSTDHHYRIIHAVGTGIRITTEYGKETTQRDNFNDTIRFNELGFFDSAPGDPLDLIPLYPGHPVRQGDEWHPSAQVKTDMGSGTARYSFIADSVYQSTEGEQLALIRVRVNAALSALPVYKDARIDVHGEGWFIWDCTVHQRRETHLSAVYSGNMGTGEVLEHITVNDNLVKHSGKISF
jgi:hypothetical protein